MSEPEKKPEPDKLEEGLKGLNLDKFGEAMQRTLKDLAPKPDPLAAKAEGALKKGASFFKKAKAALKGDEKAKEELADSAANLAGKLEKAHQSVGEILDRADKKLKERKNQPPTP
ncbi:MAG: hypothetical protein ACAH83_15675 [Alphaproteobacteria bacterium]